MPRLNQHTQGKVDEAIHSALNKWKAILRRRGRKTGHADDKLKHFRDALSKVDDIDEDDLPRTPAALHQRLRILPSRQREVQKTNKRLAPR